MQGELPAQYSPGPGRLKISDGRPALKSTRSPSRAHRLQQEAALTLSGLLDRHQVFSSHSAGRNGMSDDIKRDAMTWMNSSGRVLFNLRTSSRRARVQQFGAKRLSPTPMTTALEEDNPLSTELFFFRRATERLFADVLSVPPGCRISSLR
ncbi:hypothetical protein EYF80_051616 [Liparis tanakae]|uniref:Uncharacterized protein n=1 Tax=Liparis tanakae TaxID=230148 RepID=A0A4Z2FAQ4_9TELE|nr:hypothetical protein EYF80_051616 [Liparis tanakae]